MPDNKYFIILIGLVFVLYSNVFADQIFIDGVQHFTNPENSTNKSTNVVKTIVSDTNKKKLFDSRKILEFSVNPVSKKNRSIMKPNILVFSNNNAVYQLNFAFHNIKKVNNRQNYTVEIHLQAYSKIQIVPFDLFNQHAQLTVMGLQNQMILQEDFSFSRRQLRQTIYPRGIAKIEFIKIIPPADFLKLRQIFQSNQQVIFFLKGFQGSYRLSFSKDILNLYEDIFQYHDKLIIK